jgi:AraC-like DNA-binding protein
MHNLELHSNIPVKMMFIFFLEDLIFKPGDGMLNFEYITPFFDIDNLVEKKGRIYVDTNHMIFKRIQKIAQELDAQQACYQQAVKNHLLDILLILLRNFVKQAKRSKKNINKLHDIERLKGAIGYIQDHYNQKITLSHLSKIAYMSPTSFCRYFKKVTGTTTSNYIMRIRIDHAKELLIKSDLSITQIAHEVGIGYHSYFDIIFRRFNHMSPKDFRKKFKTQIS